MFMTMLMLLSAPQSIAVPIDVAIRSDDPVDCAATPGAIGCPGREQARYRLSLNEGPALDRKTDALGREGAECRTGQSICTSRTQRVVGADDAGEPLR